MASLVIEIRRSNNKAYLIFQQTFYLPTFRKLPVSSKLLDKEATVHIGPFCNIVVMSKRQLQVALNFNREHSGRFQEATATAIHNNRLRNFH